MIKIRQIKEEVTSLPPFRQTIMKARSMLADSSVNASELAEVLKFDVGITTNILKICNSPYYGLVKTVNSLQQAIVVLGHRELRKLLTLSGSLTYFEGKQPGYEGEYGELWRHSIATALLAQAIGAKTDNKDDDLFVAGLLHDVGKLILSHYVRDEYAGIVELVAEKGYAFDEAEQEVLGIDHALVGKIVLEEWNFSQNIVNAASCHHAFEVEMPSSVLAVALADRLSSIMGAGTLNDGMAYHGTVELSQHFGLTGDDVEMLLAHTAENLANIKMTYEQN
ncbi:MAG: HDOD domain-containing protein [Candidatus Marinimicrobia bacterium]|nr:HDOD domain-containing protein [Candidatus Neomarinimicrobiota bacterium]MCF7880486.1 HDOD domain-containing protein [Candidatus Neomarinimicrobiota bacterium]